jgi:oxygen-independent coproporphyrinogen-3 oxidase
MRMFRKRDNTSVLKNNVIYCCQEDGMVGLGAGARSYTRSILYSSEYAVGRKGVKNIIQSFIDENNEDFSIVRHGILLPEEEQKRRYIIKSLLHGEGLNMKRFSDRYTCDALSALPELGDLIDAQWAISENGILKLTLAGMELSDSIGPALYSQAILDLMEQYELR